MCNRNEVVIFDFEMCDTDGNVIRKTTTEPTSIILGKGQTFDSVEDALIEAKVGESIEVSVGCEEAFGKRNDELFVKIPLAKFEEDLNIGDAVSLRMEDGSDFEVVISDKDHESYTLDGNHPLAGVDLVFKIKLITRRPAMPSEIKTGDVRGDDPLLN